MGRETTITQAMINAAADQILAGGSKPTARSVRAAIGGGSMSTILKLLKVWQEGQAAPQDGPSMLPTALQRTLMDFMAQEIASAKVSLQAELLSAQQTIDDFVAENERLSQTIEDQAVTIDQAFAEKTELAGRYSQLESDFQRTSDDLDAERRAAEMSRTELAKAQLRLESVPRLEADLDRLRSDLERERNLRVAAEQVAAVDRARLEGMQDRATKAEQAVQILTENLAKAETSLRTTTQENNSCRLQVQAQQTALDASTRQTDELRKQLAEYRAEQKVAIETIAELRSQTKNA